MDRRYERKRRLGGGVTGEVWLATDTVLGRDVAIKYLNAVDDAVHRDLFMAEARMLARLNHPGITTLFDAALGAGGYHLIMEYVDGQPLGQFIETGNYDLKDALTLAVKILSALRYAHQQGVIHRDIKPENVMLTADGKVKLTDFGFANLVSILQIKGEYQIGTEMYMPPEQFQGLAYPTSDLFSFGVMLYELVTKGELPFSHESRLLLETLHGSQGASPRPTPLRNYAPDAPLVLEHAINRLLAAAPAERYPSAEAILNVLRPVRARLEFGGSRIQLLSANDEGILVGRDSQRLALHYAWQQTWNTRAPQPVIVTGEAGVGKTRLVADFLSRVITPHYPVFIGRGGDNLPYAPFAGALVAFIQRFPAIVGACSPSQQQLLAAYLPGAAQLLPISGICPPEMPAQQLQLELFETIRLMLEQVGPAVLWLEDVTHLDESSQALLRFLLRRLQSPVLFVATCRSDEAPPAPWWAACEAATMIDLEPLSETDTAACLTGLLSGPVDSLAVSAVYRRSHGNPLFIEEVRQYMLDTGELARNQESGVWEYRRQGRSGSLPPTLINAFQRRLSRLSSPARQSLSVAALLGDEFEFSVWAVALNDQGLALDSLDEALGLRMLSDLGDDRYRFNPANLAGALSDSLSSARRKAAHQKLFDILRQRNAAPAQLAYHAQEGGLTNEAAAHWQLAGRHAAASNAVLTAIAAFEAANALSPVLENHEMLGKLHRQTGQAQPAIDALKQAYRLADAPPAQARVLNSLAFTYWLYDQYEPAHKTATSALQLVGATEETRAVAQSHLGMIAWLTGRFGEADEHCLNAVRTLRAMLNDPVWPPLEKRRLAESLAGAANRLGLVKISLGEWPAAKSIVTLALQLRQRLNDVWGEAFCWNNLAKIAIETGEPDGAEIHLQKAVDLFSKIDSQDGLMVAYTNQGRRLLALGRAVEAQEVLNRALQLALDIGKWSAYGLGDIYLLLAEAKITRNNLAQAETALAEALHLVETAGNLEYIALGYALRSQLQQRQGQAAAARQSYDLATQKARETGSEFLLRRVGQIAGLKNG